MPKGLTLFEQNFVNEYEVNGGNAKRAYLKLRPNVQERTAEVNGSKLLRKTEVVEELQRRVDMVKDNNQFTREKILDRFDHLGSLAEKEKQYTASIHANREIAKIVGFYDQGSENNGYIALIQQITKITFNPGTDERKADFIDLPQDDED